MPPDGLDSGGRNRETRPEFRSAGRYGSELAADLVCLGRAELGVQGECLLPVVAGLLVLADAVVALEVAVRACLLVGVAGFAASLTAAASSAWAAAGSPAPCRASARLWSVKVSPYR